MDWILTRFNIFYFKKTKKNIQVKKTMLLEDPLDFKPNELCVIEFVTHVKNNKKKTFDEIQPIENVIESKNQELLPLETLISEPWISEPNYLNSLNSHPRDWQIKFVPETHKYYVAYSDHKDSHTCQFNVSVSELTKQFFPEFDSQEALENTRNSKNYNTQKRYKGMTNEQILEKWEFDRNSASHQGTFYHLLLENHCNGYDLKKYEHLIPIKQYLKWRKDFFDKEFVEFRTEFRLHSCETLRLVGTADLFAIRKNHGLPCETDDTLTVSIFDWKNTKELKMFGQKFGFGPCSKLRECNYSHYCIQQNIYKYLFETYYTQWVYNGHKYNKVKVELMKLVIIHDNNINNEAITIDVPSLQSVIHEIIEIRRLDLQQKMLNATV